MHGLLRLKLIASGSKISLNGGEFKFEGVNIILRLLEFIGLALKCNLKLDDLVTTLLVVSGKLLVVSDKLLVRGSELSELSGGGDTVGDPRRDNGENLVEIGSIDGEGGSGHSVRRGGSVYGQSR